MFRWYFYEQSNYYMCVYMWLYGNEGANSWEL